MKNDIDFDELDRAVNSLMGSASSVHGTDELPKAKTLSINATLKPGEKPAYEKLDEVAKNIGSETLIAENDTNMVKNLGEISQSESQSISVTGTTPPVAALEGEQEAVVEAPKPIVDTPAVPRPSSGRFMDVVHPSSDMKSSTPAPVADSTAVGVTSVPTVNSVQPKPASTSDIELTSPFLPDAKVEKRPLGDSSVPVKEPDYSHNDAPQEIVAINSEVAARHEANKNSQEVLDASKIESSDEIDQQLQAIESTQVESMPSSEADALRAVESVDAVASTDQQGAIFDVKDYHQPLNHPAKHKSGWGVVIVIVIIIILATAVGAGAYFLLGLGN